ncbi:MAG: putative metal-binding motif-containing protein, partial [Planctomycetota bacterium]
MNLHGAFAVSGDMMKHNVLVGLLAIGLVGGIISCDDDASTGGEVTDQDGGSDVGTGGAMDLDSTVATGDATPTPPIPDAATLGDFNDPCEAARDCLTGICVNGPDGSRVCSRRCADDCPDPWECRAVDNAGPDVQFICVAFTDTLCDPCEEDSECGRTANLCVPVGTGTYCGRDCADDPEGCPEGYTCEEITGEDGEVRGSQCVPESNACTPCEDADNDGYGDGDACDGLDCNDADPSVYAGAPELCDNQDNDCDQRSDEDIAEQPGIECLSDGACEGTTPECAGGEWQCTYGGEYEAESEATCDRIDNDCDGNVDEDFDLEVDPMNCGNCGTVCEYPNAVGECVEFRCGIGDCVAGWWDANQNPDDGCEYACVQSNEGEEICDGRDNDCDNQIDEGFDLQVDVSHCGACNRACAYDNAAPLCVEGECALGDCEDTWWDADGDAANGCEYRCIPSREGVEACDDIDNDCDNRIDEDWDFSQDTRNCGGCGIVCEFPRAVPACFGGVCGLAVCEPGWVDLDMDPSNGCELECAETNDGIETCDEADNDCDGRTDEAFDLQNDLANCGACGNVCDVANATDACIAGECRPLECDPGFWDIDQDPENGCEYACEISNEGEELCDEVDNDCDGEVDEDYDLLNDSSNCAECGNICAYPMAVGVCIEGECQQAACEAGFFDLNDDSADGCEYGPCALTNDGLEACDVIDNDCDGTIDEGFDTNIDLLHCGQCRSVCAPENAEPACVAGECRILDCDAGFVDLDGRVGTGCEYECSPSNDGVEACDDIDNDCDGNVDETFDTDTDVENCGVCGRACAYDNGVAACDAGECSFVECRPTYYDVNRNPQADGCEYGPCIITQDGNEVCDGIDNDCDGAVDEALTRDCGTDVGACRQGTQTCDAGDWGACVGEITDEPETCDNRDNDCDGNTDESLERDCGDPTGECTLGFETCDAGEWGECLPREPEDQLLPEREVCDNRDNDCDGNVDEAVTRSCGVGVGECQTGTETCDAGQWGECVDAQEPQEETCDNRDNDCDDIIDEGVTRVCGTDEGRCE